MVFPDRSIQPAYWEVKYAYQEVDFTAVNLSGGEVKISNHYDFLSLGDFYLSWQLSDDGKVVSEGTQRGLDIAPESSASVKLWKSMPKQTPGHEYHLSSFLGSDSPRGLLPADHVYVS